MINSIYVDNIIKTALLEDINYLDTTTDYLIDEDQENTARFLAKADGVLCGIDVALRVFTILQEQGFEAKVYKHDGDVLEKGDIIAEIRGKTRTLLKGERTALNLLQHMSGVATATRQAVKAIEGTNASIARSRSAAAKTTATTFRTRRCSRTTTWTPAAALPLRSPSSDKSSVT